MGQAAELVRNAFSHWEQGDSKPFFGLVAKDVRWTVIGTTEISGTYNSKSEFVAATGKLFNRFAQPLIAKVKALHQDGDTVFLQFHGSSMGVNGRPYEQDYCWVIRVVDDQVREVTAYLDTALLLDMFAD